MRNAMIISPEDNVAVAIEPIRCGETVCFLLEGCEHTLVAKQDITIYHKVAVRDLKKGEPVKKYGEHIGIAACPIRAGEHVHDHNVESHREDLTAEA